MTVFSLLYFCRQLYMFRVLSPIIRSSYNCNYSFWNWWTGSTTFRPRMVVDLVDQLTSARSCNYSCTSSWWWVSTRETCRAVYRVTQKRGTFEKPNKNWRNPTKNFIDRNWTITTCLLRESNPDYQCLKITSCRWRPPLRMQSFNLPLRFPIARCNISAGIPRISSWILCFNSSSVLGRVV